MKSDGYMVSVRLMTYNHGRFIKKAMEGIMMQKTSFPVEVVVGDDFSTDDTLDVIKSFKDSKNIRIRILERPIGGDYWKKRKELGRLYNFQNILENCTGKYIALLDGDDYWTDPLKLQKQVDLLESNQNLAISCHNVKIISDDVDVKDVVFFGERREHPRELTNFQVLLKGNYIPTLGVVFRNNNFPLPVEFTDFHVGDWPLHLLNARFGEIHYSRESMGTYRIHGQGIHR
ncbi:glycosyltransferase, partial [Xanthovirga aplysinae]|uniref:glycosyltransferase n=1 Tax=Xanthovirga aplysinae TaxID=2529853 RepID=UPI0012BBDDBC